MRERKINVPLGEAASSPQEAVEVAKRLGGDFWVIKAQILAGGRGKGTFKNGFKGGVHVVTGFEQLAQVTEQMLGNRLITIQTGEQGRPVNQVYITEPFKVLKEAYFAVMFDQRTNNPIVIASASGGVNIETLAREKPDAIIRVPIDLKEGITDEQCALIANKMNFTGPSQHTSAKEQIRRLYDLFLAKDGTMIEVNPLVETSTGQIVCLDAKLNFDDNALFRHPELEVMRDWSQEDPREYAASKFNLNYIGLDGDIACLVNGAGLAMATMDIIKHYGGEPANFLDIGGSASENQVSEAFKILNEDPRVSTILVNIFGGIMRCDIIASGVINTVNQINLKKTVVIRLQGTNAEQAKELVERSNTPIIMLQDLDQAAMESVKLAKMKSAERGTNTS